MGFKDRELIVQALRFEHFREVSIDLWGKKVNYLYPRRTYKFILKKQNIDIQKIIMRSRG